MHTLARRRGAPPSRFSASTLSLAVTLALGLPAPAFADAPLKEVVVTATRQEAEADQVPATVTTVDRAALDRRLPADDAALFADEPDVAMARDLRRHGATRINIRGIEDNRVIQLVDGVRLPDFYNGGGPTNFTVSAMPGVMSDFLKRVEIVRGPASSLYGSDAIGGVVGFVTLDPADLLGKDDTRALRYRAAYTGANDGLTQSLLGALRGDAAEMLLGYAQGRGEEFDNQGDAGGTSTTRAEPNPMTTREKGLLAKLVARPAAGHKFSVMLEGREQQAETDVLRLPASLPRVSSMRGDDESRRARGSIEWEHKPAQGFYDRLTARAYWQQGETDNFNVQARSNTSASCSAVAGGSNNCRIEQDFLFEQETLGAGVQAEKAMQAGGRTHLLAWGADLSRVRVEEKRDSGIWNLTTGTFAKSLAGETYPLRDFATGETDTLGLFAQNEIFGFFGERLTLLPSLRFDRTRLTPKPDALSQQAVTTLGRQAVEKSESAFSPKLGARWKLDDEDSLFGQIARGFRAPNYDEVNGAFVNTAQRYSTVPNPNLEPETSVGVELGWRRNAATHRWQLALYDNRYRNFIESVSLACPGDPLCYSPTPAWRTFTSVNLSRVRIYGAEARGTWEFAAGWALNGAVAWAHGEDESADRPLDSIEPARLSLALSREAGDWGGEARLRAASAVKRVNDYNGTTYSPWFRPAGYGTLDFSAWRQLGRHARVTAAANNLLDKKYWLWSDIRQADARNPAGVDFYSQPGRNFSLALQLDF